MDSTNLNTFPISERGSSSACINDELCCANILSAIGIAEDSDASKSIPKLKGDLPCSGVCTIDFVEGCEAPHEIYLSDIKLESGNNEVASNADKISTSEAINPDSSTSCTSHIKIEPANRRDADLDDNLGEFVRYVLNASKIPHKIFDNDYARRLRCVEQSNANVNITDPKDSVKVKTDTFSTHFDVPFIGEEVTKKSVLKAENPTNIVCCPDITGKIKQSHSKINRKKIQQTDGGQKSGNIGQSDANELGAMFIDVNSKVRRPPTPYKGEELNICETPLPSSSLGSRTNPVEEFILPDILPDKLQPKIDGGILAPSSTKGFEFSPKFIPKPKNFKRGGAPTDFRPKMKKFIMEDFNKITGQNKASNSTIECSECNLTFKKRFHLKEHNKSNHSKRKFAFACSWEGCNFACYLEKGLKTHLISHTNEKPYICNLCDVGFNTRGKLNKHILSHSDTKPFKCHECNYDCSSKGDLKRHSVIHTGAKKFACTICDYAGYRKDNLKAHMLTHSGEKPFPCTLCSVKCSRNGDLIRHMLTHSGERPFGCSQCNYKCLKKSDLSRHALTHTGERRHPCTICTHVSATKSNLKLHMAIHKS